MSKLPVFSISIDASKRIGTHWWFVALHRGAERNGEMVEQEVKCTHHKHITSASLARLRRAQEELVSHE